MGATLTGAMAPSAEVTELMSRFYEAASKGDYESLDRIVSRNAGMLWIGTDPGEWWDTPEAVSRAWRAQTAELGRPAAITGGKLVAWQHGDVAWVADQPVFHLQDGRQVPFRLTVVWLREPQGWRVVQAHTSFGVPNESVIRPA